MGVSPHNSVLQSPWYWVYAFCAAAMVGLVLIGPKFYERQVMEERNFQGRTRVMRSAAGKTDPQSGPRMSQPGQTMLTLGPLYVLLAIGFVGAWLMVWWQHFRRRSNR